MKRISTSDVSKVFEKIPTAIFESMAEGSVHVAEQIAAAIRQHQAEGKSFVLGLATGASPVMVYQELVRMHREDGLRFTNVITFNLDEYYPMEPERVQSYVRFMNHHLFNHIDIDPSNIFIPDGTVSADKLAEYCDWYERKIEEFGGIDLQLLGIGRNGHIGFNEPGTGVYSRTRLVPLDYSTRLAASTDFFGIENTPYKAITMGIKQIMKAGKVILLAWGEHKSTAVHAAVEEVQSHDVPASYLQSHPDATFVLDPQSAAGLTRAKAPWLVDDVIWDDALIRKAVVETALKLEKPVLMLTDRDYAVHGLSSLLAERGNAYDINIEVFNQLQHTITGWPGGKPGVDDHQRPERAAPPKKRVLIFSPHPDDDIISMGGTFIRLHEQGHEVHVAYQTSGNIAVSDDDAIRFTEFVRNFNVYFDIEQSSHDKELSEKMLEDVVQHCRAKKGFEKDTAEVRAIKGMIRRSEAYATCRFVGLPPGQVHMLNMPFYETGEVQKNPLGEDDITIVMNIISEIRPHQIFAAGDLADPHGTHKVCLDAVLEACQRLNREKFMDDCWLWLYRGAWQEWNIESIDMAVPMSPQQVIQKRHGIFKHQSQKDHVVFQGNDSREFWQRAEERNAETARLYDQLGLPQYAALEAFKRYKF